jgi:hypothetical protein
MAGGSEQSGRNDARVRAERERFEEALAEAEFVDRVADLVADRVVERLAPYLGAGGAPSAGLVDAGEVARMAGRTRRWVYEHAGVLGAVPWCVRISATDDDGSFERLVRARDLTADLQEAVPQMPCKPKVCRPASARYCQMNSLTAKTQRSVRPTKSPAFAGLFYRGAEIRTRDLTDPNGARYQAAPRPDAGFSIPHGAIRPTSRGRSGPPQGAYRPTATATPPHPPPRAGTAPGDYPRRGARPTRRDRR